MWIVRGDFLIYDNVVVHELLYHLVDKLSTLVPDQFDWATESTTDVFVQKFGCRIVVQAFYFHPFRIVVIHDEDIFVAGSCHARFERFDKIETPFLKWL